IFIPKTTIYFIAESGNDLSDGQVVKFRGFKIGRVKNISMNDQGKVEVKLNINNNYMKWIKADSRAKLVKEGFIGDSVIEISPGSPNKREMSDGDRIGFEREAGLGELAANIQAEITPVIADVKKIIEYLDNPQGDFKAILANISQFSEKLIATSNNLDNLLSEIQTSVNNIAVNVDTLSGAIKQEMNQVAGSVDELSASVKTGVIPEIDSVLKNMNVTVSGIDATVNSLRQDLEEVLSRVDVALENVRQTTEDLKRVSSGMPAVLDQSEDLMGKTEQIMDSVQNIWLFRPKSNNPDNKTLKMDSYE
ncbi:MAG: MCE family protein, partial [Deltaproteobacteria bacterium]|nr:MCE family protein [Deltaproteobacteria bacterium]